MNKQNRVFWILTIIGICNIIAAVILLGTVPDPMVGMVLLASGILLIIGGYADKKERKKKRKKES